MKRVAKKRELAAVMAELANEHMTEAELLSVLSEDVDTPRQVWEVVDDLRHKAWWLVYDRDQRGQQDSETEAWAWDLAVLCGFSPEAARASNIDPWNRSDLLARGAAQVVRTLAGPVDPPEPTKSNPDRAPRYSVREYSAGGLFVSWRVYDALRLRYVGEPFDLLSSAMEDAEWRNNARAGGP